MTDHGALVVTAWATIAGAVGTIGAVVVALGLALREAKRDRLSRQDADRQRREDEDARRRTERRTLYTGLVLEIAKDYERLADHRWNLQVPTEHIVTVRLPVENRIRANLSALPLSYLGVLRWELNVMPDARDQGRVASYGAHTADKIRDEIRSLLYNLSGEGTAQDYEPPGSPTANRPRPTPVYP